MAAIKFESANAKASTYAAETLNAQNAGITVDPKKGLSIGAESTYAESGYDSIDVSESAFFKTVSVSSSFEGEVNILGNASVSNTFYAGGGGGVLDGGAGQNVEISETKSKLFTSADKFYGGAGNDIFVYSALGGKDVIYNYGDGDVVRLDGFNSETQSLSFVDKNGGLTVTISDSDDTTVAKNSVLTIDGKTRAASSSYGFVFVDEDGAPIATHGVLEEGVLAYGLNKKGAQDTSILSIGGASRNATIDASNVSSLIKTISGNNTNAIYVIGNANANNISIGSGGGTIDGGGTAEKPTNDNLYGVAGKAVTFVYNGGKDVVYNYKTGDKIIGESLTFSKYNGADALYVDPENNKNTLTIKYALGKVLNINGEDDENSHTLPAGLAYDKWDDAKGGATKITANDVEITAGPTIQGSQTVYREIDGEIWERTETVVAYSAISVGGESGEIAEGVKEVDLSASSAPVIVDTSENASITSVKMGKDGGKVVGHDGGDNRLAQTFTAGGGADIFVINAEKVLGADDPSKAKSDSIVNIGKSDKVQITGYGEEDVVSFAEKGKDLSITVNGYVVATVKNATTVFGKSVPLYVLDSAGNSLLQYPTPMPTGLDYATKKNGTADKTGLVADETFNSTLINAEPYGGAAIKTIDAKNVSLSSAINIIGSSNSNVITAPTAAVDVTIDGGAGSDNVTLGGGAAVYYFHAQAGGKKDVLTGYKDGDIIIFDGNEVESVANISEEGILYEGKNDTEINGFNDSKAAVVINFSAKNSLTLNNTAGMAIRVADISAIDEETGELDESQVYTFGHVLPSGLDYDAKKTTVLVAETNPPKSLTVDLSDSETFFSSVKNVDFSDKAVTASIVGSTVANDIKVGTSGSTVDTGAIPEDLPEGSKFKPVADKVQGGAGRDVFIYDVGYGKDVYSNVDSKDVISLGSGVSGWSDLTITDNKKGGMTVAISGEGVTTEKGALNTTANSTFTINKADNNAVTFNIGGTNYVYGKLDSGVSIDAKYATLSVASDANLTVDASMINSLPKIIDARGSEGGNKVLIGNGQADAIYAGGAATTLFGGTAGTKALKDTLYGKSGSADTFLFTTQDSAKGKETDIISNYDSDTDIIVLDRAPTSVNAGGKNVVLTFTEDDPNKEGKTVSSTLTINGIAQDDTLKKLNNIDANYGIKIAVVDSLYGENGDLSSAIGSAETETYYFTKGKYDWGDETNIKTGSATGEEEGGESEQYAATDGWFNEVVSTDNASVSELDSILDVKGALNGDLATLDGDAYFTNTSFESKAAAVTGARHRSKK